MIKNLFNQGLNKSEIAKMLGITRKTVRKYIKKDNSPKYIRKIATSKLDSFKSYINERLSKYNLTSQKIYEEIVKQGYIGKYGIVNKYVQKIKNDLKIKAVMRFETLPGEQAQVDWGYCGEIYNPEQRRWIKLNCFLIVLGYSRMKYIEFFERQDIYSFLKGHNNAFMYFNGYTRDILYDNLKSVVLKRAIRAKNSDFNKKFMDYAGYYGFNPILARPYKPNTKGKVENSVNYVKQNFIAGEEFKSLGEVNKKALNWLNKVNNLMHCTTREKPIERFKKENLVSIENKNLYDLSLTYYRKVYIDCHFSFEANFYSVPYKYAGKEVLVKVKNNKMIVKYRDKKIAEHDIANGVKCKYITKPDHLKDLKELRCRSKLPRIKKHINKKKSNIILSKVTNNFEDVEICDPKIYEGVVYADK